MANEYEIVMHGSFSGVPVSTRHYYRNTVGGNPIAFQAFANELGTRMEDAMKQHFCANMQYNSMTIRLIQPNNFGTTYVPSGWPFTGLSDATESMAPTSVLRVRKTTTGPGLPHTGMIRLSGLSQLFCPEGVVGTVALADLTAKFSWLTATLTSGGSQQWLPLLYNREQGTYNTVTGVSVDQEIGTQGTRKYKSRR